MPFRSPTVSEPPLDVSRQGKPAVSLVGLLETRGVTKVYRMGDVEVQTLRRVDLDLFKGEFVVLLGPSGCGKSTLQDTYATEFNQQLALVHRASGTENATEEETA